MPKAAEDRIVSPAGKKDAAAKAHAAFMKEYGVAKGTEYFYAWLNKRRARQRGSRSGT